MAKEETLKEYAEVVSWAANASTAGTDIIIKSNECTFYALACIDGAAMRRDGTLLRLLELHVASLTADDCELTMEHVTAIGKPKHVKGARRIIDGDVTKRAK